MRALLLIGRWAWVGVIGVTLVFAVQYLMSVYAYEDSARLARDVTGVRGFQERMFSASVSQWVLGMTTGRSTSEIAAEADVYIEMLIVDHDLLVAGGGADGSGVVIAEALISASRELQVVSELTLESVPGLGEVEELGRLFGGVAGAELAEGPFGDLVSSPAELGVVYGTLGYAASNATITRYVDAASLLASERADAHFADLRRSGERGIVALMTGGILAAIGYAWAGHRARRARWEVERARERAELGSEFVSLASHELRTPLVGIYGFSELLLEEEGLPAHTRDWAERIHKESARLTRIVEDLLDVSRIESGRMEVRREVVDFGEVLDSVFATFEGVSALHHLRIRGDLDARVVGDQDKLIEVLSNLVDNAIKYSIDGGLVVIDVRIAGERLEVRVIDEGVGVPEAQQVAIFERFGRARLSETEHVRSTGLGLYLVQELLRLMESTISVESNEGDGATFSFSLPLAIEGFEEASDDAMAA